MQNEIKSYTKEKLVIFSIDIKQKKHTNGTYKKYIDFPSKWTNFSLNKTKIDKNYNGIALLTGKINNLIIIDIDNIEHWNKLLKENNEGEPNTVKVISGSGGIHYYFQYDKDLEEVKSRDHCFGKDYNIDIKTNGGCIIAPPSKYYNENFKKEVEYKWEKSIFEHKPSKIPKWIKDLLLDKKEKQKVKTELIENKKDNTSIQEKNLELSNLTIDGEDLELNFTINDIECILNMLKEERNNSYQDWVSVGMCLHNINPKYLLLWEKWSQQSDKYEDGKCEEKWNSFKKDKNGLKIGTLLLWAKGDNSQKYDDFMKKKKMNKMILSKYPNEKLILGDTKKVSERSYYMDLKNKECLIKGCEHHDMAYSMYIDVVDKFMSIKCRHPECHGKIYPCNHILMNKNEMNIAFNGDVTININNGNDEEFIDFQQIDIYDDPKINELVYNGLSSKPFQLAEIIYYFYENDYIYGEDNQWYMFNNHKWVNVGTKNTKLRLATQIKLKELYKQLYKYYKENEEDKKKIISIKKSIEGLGETNLKNNIMTELIDLYTENKNPNRDFTKKLDSNNHLIGFDNGVFDLETFEFREGRQEDHISMSVGYDYSDKHTEKYDDLLRFLEDIQPNKGEREYMLTYLSIGLVGNLLELFTIFTGSGRNGKSKLVDLIELAFGEYWGTVSSSLFTRKRPDANSPDPGLLSLSTKRIITSSEPEKKENLNSGFIKFLTGKDSTTLRNCHSNEILKFKPRFITIFICNDIPDCDEIDKAFSKRLRCVNFPTEFVDEPTNENQKKINVNINKNFEHWKLDFMLLLIEKYKKYIETHELKPTENILKWTNQYKEDTDLYLQFINECTENSETENTLTVDLYEIFKTWYKNNNPNTKIPSNKEFLNNIRKYKNVDRIRIGEKQGRGIKNIKLI
jgi:P4 family phage/plasmid primase-like protien